MLLGRLLPESSAPLARTRTSRRAAGPGLSPAPAYLRASRRCVLSWNRIRTSMATSGPSAVDTGPIPPLDLAQKLASAGQSHTLAGDHRRLSLGVEGMRLR